MFAPGTMSFAFTLCLVICTDYVGPCCRNQHVAIDSHDRIAFDLGATCKPADVAAFPRVGDERIDIQSVGVADRAADVRNGDDRRAFLREEPRRMQTDGAETLDGDTHVVE